MVPISTLHNDPNEDEMRRSGPLSGCGTPPSSGRPANPPLNGPRNAHTHTHTHTHTHSHSHTHTHTHTPTAVPPLITTFSEETQAALREEHFQMSSCVPVRHLP